MYIQKYLKSTQKIVKTMSTKVDLDDFIIVRNNTHGEVVTSREAVRYWDCRKISDFEYQVNK